MFKNPSSRKGSPGGSARNVPHTRIEDEKEIEEIYEFRRELGRGSFGRVFEALCRETETKWAIKAVNKEKAGSYAVKLLEREVNIMKMIDHKHVICLKEVYETPTKMFLVMELCDQGELCDLLKKRQTLNEEEALTVIRQLVDAIAYLHDLDIVHRDLKLENILLCKPVAEEPLNIKISDFGLSYVKGSGEAMMQSVCGTPMYMAPEVIDEHEYSRQCDIWSIGVILFILLTGSPPFQAPTEEKLYQLIKQGVLDFTHPCWQTNESAKNLLEGMLEVDPAHRSTAKEIQDHPWVNGNNQSSARRNVIQMMREYNLEQKRISNTNNNHEEIKDEDATRESPTPTIVTTESPTPTIEQNDVTKKTVSKSTSKTNLKKESKESRKSSSSNSPHMSKSRSTSYLPSSSSSSNRENNSRRTKPERTNPSYMQPTQSSSAPTNPAVRSTRTRKSNENTR